MDNDTPPENNAPDESQELRQARLQRLTASNRPASATVNTRYSKFIKRVQIILPIIALILISVIFSWNSFQKTPVETIATPPEEEQKIGKNELLNPKFESLDEKGQPYTLSAERAIQGETNENLLLLESPEGKIILTEGNEVSIRSDKGTYEQDVRKLFLEGNVAIFHDLGYEMYMDALNVDMKASTAHSDTDVSGAGPEGTIEAKGLNASSVDETLIFTGPAKLVLTLDDNALSFGGLVP